MKKVLSLMLVTALLLSVCTVAVSANATKNDQINWILDSAKGSGEFSYEFELAPTQAQIDAGQPGQTGIVEGKDGLIRVYHENRTAGVPNGTYVETTNSNAMAIFARNYRLLTLETAQSWFTFEGDVMSGATATNIINGDTVTKKISNLKNSLSGLTDGAPQSTKTILWQIIDAARGNGEFSYEFELAPTQAQIDAGQPGQTGIVEAKDGVVRVYHENRTAGVPNGTYVETTNSNAMAIFANNYRLLTQRTHNHNNEVVTGDAESRPVKPSTFPAWLGLTTTAWANGNFELFPVVTHATLVGAANPFEMNLVPARGDTVTPEQRANDMLFIYENGVPAAARYLDHNGNAVFKKISNYKNSLSGLTDGAPQSTKTILWQIINAARGNGEFSYDFEIQVESKGVIKGLITSQSVTNGSPRVADALEILKEIVGIKPNAAEGNPAALITKGSQDGGSPRVADALEILKSIVGIPSLVGCDKCEKLPCECPAGTEKVEGKVVCQNGVVIVYTFDSEGTLVQSPNSVAMTVFAQHFKLLTQRSHNHNNEVVTGDPESRPVNPATFPAWLGLTTTAWANGNFELFPVVAPATLANAANPFEMNLVPARGDTVTPEQRANDMLFIYENGTIVAARYFDSNGNVVFKKISNLKNSVN